jgi:thiol-disulfide isomerase/thioredoxin
MKEKKNPLIYIVLALVTTAVGYFIYDNFFAPAPAQEGDMLPDQTIPSIYGSGSVSFSDYRGKVLVIDFLSPVCEPCKVQIEVLQEIKSINGVEIISINMDRNYDDMQTLQTFADAEGITWFFGHNPPSAIAFEVEGVPTIIVVDKNGLIVHRGHLTSLQEFDTILSRIM